MQPLKQTSKESRIGYKYLEYNQQKNRPIQNNLM